jgi:WD40 repeat protein
LLNVQKPAETAVLQGENHLVTDLAFSPDAKRPLLATGGAGGHLILHDLSAGQESELSPKRLEPVYAVVFAPLTDRLAIGSGMQNRHLPSGELSGGEVHFWNTAQGNIQVAQRSRRSTPRIAISPDGHTLAAALDTASLAPGEIELWDVAAKQVRTTLTGYTRSIYTLAISPDGKLLASGSSDGITRGETIVWDVATERPAWRLNEPVWVLSLAFSPDGQVLAVSDFNKRLALYRAATGELIKVHPQQERLHDALTFRPTARPWPPQGGM